MERIRVNFNGRYGMNLCSVKDSKLLYIMLILIYRIFGDWVYCSLIVPIYGSNGFTSKVSAGSMALSYAVLVYGAIAVYKSYRNENKFSHEVWWCLFLLVYVPFTSMMGCGSFDSRFCICSIIYWTVLFILINLEDKAAKINIKLKSDSTVKKAAFIIFIAFNIFIMVYISWKHTGFRLNFRFDNVYILREEAAGFKMSTAMRYMYSWAKMALFMMASISACRKKYLLYGVSAMCLLLSFGIDGSKGTVFALLVMSLMFFLSKWSLRDINLLFLAGFPAMTFMAFLENKILHTFRITAYLVRRVLYVPVLLESFYFDYFHGKIPDYFRSSFLRHFGFRSPYPNFKEAISANYLHMETGSANNGLIADAITNLGYIGLLVMPIMLFLAIKLFDAASREVKASLFSVWAFILAENLANSFLLTVLMTHGGLVMMVGIYLYGGGKRLFCREGTKVYRTSNM